MKRLTDYVAKITSYKSKNMKIKSTCTFRDCHKPAQEELTTDGAIKLCQVHHLYWKTAIDLGDTKTILLMWAQAHGDIKNFLSRFK